MKSWKSTDGLGRRLAWNVAQIESSSPADGTGKLGEEIVRLALNALMNKMSDVNESGSTSAIAVWSEL
jgi:hypothetical protein